MIQVKDFMIGKTVTRYQILEQLGQGGMSVVYKARDNRLGRLVALKFLSEEMHERGGAFERLEQEARTASAINHPGICTIYDIVEGDGRPFIVMEFIEGQTLRQTLTKRRLTLHEALGYGAQIADALGSAHAMGVVHRDINPSNLFITQDGRLKVLDFGIATVASTALATRPTLTGTLGYMSPEQARLETIDARSDIFSVGVVLYEMLTCRRPFRGTSAQDTIQQIVSAKPRVMRTINPSIPLAAENVVNQCLRKSAGERYQSAHELALALLKVRARGPRSAGKRAPTEVGEVIRDLLSNFPTVEMN